MKSRYWGESQCRGTWLHHYVSYIETPEGTADICVRCKKRIFTPVRDGAINNEVYISHHKRELLHPIHPYFNHEYGRK